MPPSADCIVAERLKRCTALSDMNMSFSTFDRRGESSIMNVGRSPNSRPADTSAMSVAIGMCSRVRASRAGCFRPQNDDASRAPRFRMPCARVCEVMSHSWDCAAKPP